MQPKACSRWSARFARAAGHDDEEQRACQVLISSGYILDIRSPDGPVASSQIDRTLSSSKARRVSSRTWEIEAKGKLSRFLRELVPLGGDPPPSTISPEPIQFNGVVRVQGESVIAVGALWFSQETEWFSSVIVTAEPLD